MFLLFVLGMKVVQNPGRVWEALRDNPLGVVVISVCFLAIAIPVSMLLAYVVVGLQGFMQNAP